MSKRNNDGDVIANRLSLVEAKGQRLLASLFGSQLDSPSNSNGAISKDEDEDLKEEYGHDRLGVGGILPKDIEDGSFTKRIPASNDKLLEQLIGKKRAKAHLAAKQEAARPNAKTQRHGKPVTTKKEESEDEEEGRAAAFKSKKRKANISKSVQAVGESIEDVDERSGLPSEGHEDEKNKPTNVHAEAQDSHVKHNEKSRVTQSSIKAPNRTKAKPTSFLDEMLADRSKKRKKKGTSQS